MPRSMNRSCEGRNDSPAYNRALEQAEGAHRQARLEIAALAVGEERIERISGLARIVVQEHAHRVRVGVVGCDATKTLDHRERDRRNRAASSRAERGQWDGAGRADAQAGRRIASRLSGRNDIDDRTARSWRSPYCRIGVNGITIPF